MSRPLCTTMRLGGATSLVGEQSATRLFPPRSGLCLIVVAVFGMQSLIQFATLRQPRAASVRGFSEIVNLEPTQLERTTSQCPAGNRRVCPSHAMGVRNEDEISKFVIVKIRMIFLYEYARGNSVCTANMDEDLMYTQTAFFSKSKPLQPGLRLRGTASTNH